MKIHIAMTHGTAVYQQRAQRWCSVPLLRLADGCSVRPLTACLRWWKGLREARKWKVSLGDSSAAAACIGVGKLTVSISFASACVWIKPNNAWITAVGRALVF